MKKFLIGCSVFFLVVILALVGGGIFVGMKVKKFANQAETNFKAIDQLNKDYPFTPPTPTAGAPSLDAERLAAYFQTRTDVWKTISSDAGVTSAIAVINRASAKKGDPTAGEMISMVTTGNRLVKSVGEVMKRHEISPMEYQWITQQIYGTLVEGKKLNLTVSTDTIDKIKDSVDAIGQAQGQSGGSVFDGVIRDGLRGFVPGDIPGNEELLKPYIDQILEQKMHFFEIIMMSMEVQRTNSGNSIKIGGETIDLGNAPVPPDAPEPPAEAEGVTTKTE